MKDKTYQQVIFTTRTIALCVVFYAWAAVMEMDMEMEKSLSPPKDQDTRLASSARGPQAEANGNQARSSRFNGSPAIEARW